MPQIRVAWANVTTSVLWELFRYAGSYQLVSVLQILYGAVVPIAILRAFGAEAAGVYALAFRLQNSAQMLPDAFLVPVLSGGAKLFGSGSVHDMERLLRKSFKITFGLTVLPLGFLSVFGVRLIYAWTGQTNALFAPTLWLVCAAGLFSTFSILGLVLYRVSGRALLDNIRQAVCLLILLCMGLSAAKLGFLGVLDGLAVTEFLGAAFMLFAITKTFQGFKPESLFPDALRLALAATIVLGVGILTTRVPIAWAGSGRQAATLSLCAVCAACAAALWPALIATGSLTANETKTFLGVFRSRRFSAVAS